MNNKTVARVVLAAAIAAQAIFAGAQATTQSPGQNVPAKQDIRNLNVPLVPVASAAASPVQVQVSNPAFTEIEGRSESPGLAPLSLDKGPEPAIAWLFAIGFLALVVLRRTRDSASL